MISATSNMKTVRDSSTVIPGERERATDRERERDRESESESHTHTEGDKQSDVLLFFLSKAVL